MPETLPDPAAASAVAGLREHYRQHKSPLFCATCMVWQAYLDQDGAALGASLEKLEEEAVELTDVLNAARRMRAHWGEASWTAKDVG